MIRGTTPTLEFILPFSVETLAEAWVTFSQQNTVILNKVLEECKCEEQKLVVNLTQAETLLLNCRRDVEIQVRVRTKEGQALVSNIITTHVSRILKGGEI